jgi:hypothetical protein
MEAYADDAREHALKTISLIAHVCHQHAFVQAADRVPRPAGPFETDGRRGLSRTMSRGISPL